MSVAAFAFKTRFFTGFTTRTPQLPNLYSCIQHRSSKWNQICQQMLRQGDVTAGYSSSCNHDHNSAGCMRNVKSTQQYTSSSRMSTSNTNTMYNINRSTRLTDLSRSGFHKAMTRNISQQPQDKNADPDQKKEVKKITFFIPNPFNFFRQIRVKMLSWLIQVYFDKDFNLDDFASGAKQAALIVSQRLSEGAFENLDGLLSSKVLTDIRDRYNKMSEQERKCLSIGKVLASFPFDIGMDYYADGTTERYKVNIRMQFLYWGKDLDGPSNPLIKIPVHQYQHCEFEFQRDISPNAEPEWIITDINYPSLYQQQHLK